MHRLLTILTGGLGLLPAVSATNATSLMREAVAAEARQDSRGALALLLQADRLQPNDALILQKIARQYSDLVVEQAGMAAKKDCVHIALGYSERALALNPEDPVNVLSLAVCHGKLALYGDTADKVRYSRLVKEEADRALALDPNYAWAHHVLGRWNYEVATLGVASKFFVKLFYGGLPLGSFAEGIRHLERAVALEPDELDHRLELGFAYAAARQATKARETWIRGLAMPARGKHDEPAKERARQALARLDEDEGNGRDH